MRLANQSLASPRSNPPAAGVFRWGGLSKTTESGSDLHGITETPKSTIVAVSRPVTARFRERDHSPPLGSRECRHHQERRHYHQGRVPRPYLLAPSESAHTRCNACHATLVSGRVSQMWKRRSGRPASEGTTSRLARQGAENDASEPHGGLSRRVRGSTRLLRRLHLG
jgi:hypothetical protein